LKVYLQCDEGREEFFRDILEPDFVTGTLSGGDLSQPDPGDVVLLDLAGKAGDWLGYLDDLRRALREEVRLVAVLCFEQMRTLDGRASLDDFLTEGATGEEIRARLRRLAKNDTEATSHEEGLKIDENRYEVRKNGVPVELTFKEFELLRFLADRPGKVFTREILLEQVWGYDYFGGSRTVDVHIRRIRSKIDREDHTYIRTVRGVGYIFEPKPPVPKP
jgi:DNA-binding response OmpR family regulator